LGAKKPGSQKLPLMGVLDNFAHDPQQQYNKHKFKDYQYQQEQDLKEFNDLEKAVTEKSKILCLDPAPYSYSNSPEKSSLSQGGKQNMYANGPRYTMERTSNEKKYEDFFKNKKQNSGEKFDNNFFLESDDLEVDQQGNIVERDPDQLRVSLRPSKVVFSNSNKNFRPKKQENHDKKFSKTTQGLLRNSKSQAISKPSSLF
jgi:hypothetical protein